jgi:hypothetical protein
MIELTISHLALNTPPPVRIGTIVVVEASSFYLLVTVISVPRLD